MALRNRREIGSPTEQTLRLALIKAQQAEDHWAICKACWEPKTRKSKPCASYAALVLAAERARHDVLDVVNVPSTFTHRRAKLFKFDA